MNGPIMSLCGLSHSRRCSREQVSRAEVAGLQLSPCLFVIGCQMSRTLPARHTRRSLLQGAAGVALASRLPRPVLASSDLTLFPGLAKVRLGDGRLSEVDAWAYNGSVPGPQLRVRQGEHVSVAVDNRLAQETTVHF